MKSTLAWSTARPIELTHLNCSAFEGKEIFKSPTDNLITTEANLVALQRLSWVDVFNATAWLLANDDKRPPAPR